MQHQYEFYIKGTDEDHYYHQIYTTDHGRMSKAGKKILSELNKLRQLQGLPVLVNGYNMEDFRLKKHR